MDCVSCHIYLLSAVDSVEVGSIGSLELNTQTLFHLILFRRWITDIFKASILLGKALQYYVKLAVIYTEQYIVVSALFLFLHLCDIFMLESLIIHSSLVNGMCYMFISLLFCVNHILGHLT